MDTNAGIWIDHRKAVIVLVSADGEETMELRSNVDRQPGRIDGLRSIAPYEAQMVKADDRQERKYVEQLDRFYTKVIESIHHAESILVFGPGEAKGEFKKRLGQSKFEGRILDVESADGMTDRQIAASVRERFSEEDRSLAVAKPPHRIEGNGPSD